MNAIDFNWFATQFHVDLFKNVFDIKDSKLFVTGWPMEYLNNILNTENHKEDIIKKVKEYRKNHSVKKPSPEKIKEYSRRAYLKKKLQENNI